MYTLRCVGKQKAFISEKPKSVRLSFEGLDTFSEEGKTCISGLFFFQTHLSRWVDFEM